MGILLIPFPRRSNAHFPCIKAWARRLNDGGVDGLPKLISNVLSNVVTRKFGLVLDQWILHGLRQVVVHSVGI